MASIQQQLASLSLQEAPVIGAFNPKKGDIVLAQFSADDSWNRAMVRVTTDTSIHFQNDFFSDCQTTFFPLKLHNFGHRQNLRFAVDMESQ